MVPWKMRARLSNLVQGRDADALHVRDELRGVAPLARRDQQSRRAAHSSFVRSTRLMSMPMNQDRAGFKIRRTGPMSRRCHVASTSPSQPAWRICDASTGWPSRSLCPSRTTSPSGSSQIGLTGRHRPSHESICHGVMKAAGEFEKAFPADVEAFEAAWSQAKLRSTTQRYVPSPLPRRAVAGTMRRCRTWSR